MSEYVEARYAKLVLREASAAKDDVASRLVNDLLRDLYSPQKIEPRSRSGSDINTRASAQS